MRQGVSRVAICSTGVLKKSAACSAVIAVLASPLAYGFEIETGNPDLEVRWDNTVRLNVGARAQEQDKRILASPNLDDGDRNFSNGSLVTSRFDLLSELDINWKRRFGARFSGVAWWDPAYGNLDNKNNSSANTFINGRPTAGELSPHSKRYLKGGSGEFMDAFMFMNFDAGDVPVNVKLGQHTVYWGESLFGNGAIHGISYAQNSQDIQKGFMTPGVEAKEIFRPRGGLTAQAQVTDELSISGQWFYNWQAMRLPESGSYLGISDALDRGADSLIAGPLHFRNVHNLNASRNSKSLGDYGLAARWSPKALDSTFGFYYRKTNDIQPQILLSPSNLTYGTAYGKDIQMLGVSLAKNIGGVSIGAELSHRKNMPLNSDAVIVSSAALKNELGTPGALGNTMHGLINMIWVAPRTAFFDMASLSGELTWMQWMKVTQNDAVFKGRSGYNEIDRVTKNYYGLALNFTPSWIGVMPGVDISLPMSASYGLKGNAAVAGGGNEKAGAWSLGVSADINMKYRLDLKYTGYYGSNASQITNPNATVFNGSYASLADRGWFSLTFKTTF